MRPNGNETGAAMSSTALDLRRNYAGALPKSRRETGANLPSGQTAAVSARLLDYWRVTLPLPVAGRSRADGPPFPGRAFGRSSLIGTLPQRDNRWIVRLLPRSLHGSCNQVFGRRPRSVSSYWARQCCARGRDGQPKSQGRYPTPPGLR